MAKPHQLPKSPRNAKKKAETKAHKKATAKPVKPIVDLDALLDKAAVDPFWRARGHAIQSYANVEQGLCLLFSSLSGTTPYVAGVVFFKIVSSQSRDEILDKLMKNKYGQEYTAFWNSLMQLIGALTQTRNRIVHWNVCSFAGNKDNFSGLGLVPSNVYDTNRDKSSLITTRDLLEFIAECLFVGRLCTHFFLFLGESEVERLESEQSRTWHGIFRKSIVYPPPSNHPLFQKMKEPETPPGSSPE